MKDITKDMLRQILRSRPVDGHKGTFGHALLIAGKYGMAGASILAARSCMRSGVGKLTVHSPIKNNDIMQISIPEAIIQHDADNETFTQATTLAPYNALGIGPGIGTSEATVKALHQQLKMARESNIPTVIDADALNILSTHPNFHPSLPSRTIITPHAGEYTRLIKSGLKTEKFTLVAKSHRTTIISPDSEHQYRCPWGNSGMGTAGSGDVLTGIILALLAQGYTPHQSAILGVSLHAIAGDIAANTLGQYSLTATDIIDTLGKAFLQIQ